MRALIALAILAAASTAQAQAVAQPTAQPVQPSQARTQPAQAAPAQVAAAEAKPAVRLRHTKPGGQTFVTGGGLICQHVGEKIACF